MSKVEQFLSGMSKVGEYVSNQFYFNKLKDTPTGYLGHSGDYLVVNDGESGIHFTGIEKIASDLTDYGFSADGNSFFTVLQDTPTGYQSGYYLRSTETGIEYKSISGLINDLESNQYTVIKNYNTLNDLPDNITNINGDIIKVGCDLYTVCDGELIPVGTKDTEDVPVDENAPACVNNLSEYQQYQEYKDTFLANNLSSTFLNGLNNIDPLVYNVCMFVESNLNQDSNIVKIIETDAKWGLFSEPTNISITGIAAINQDTDIECNFSHWSSSDTVFDDANSQGTSCLINQDALITGHFYCSKPGVHFFSEITSQGSTTTRSNDSPHFSYEQMKPLIDQVQTGPHVTHEFGGNKYYIFKFNLEDFDDANISTWYTNIPTSDSSLRTTPDRERSEDYWRYVYEDIQGVTNFQMQYYNGATSYNNSPRLFINEMSGDTVIRRWPVIQIESKSNQDWLDSNPLDVHDLQPALRLGINTYWQGRSFKLELVYE